MIQAKRVYEAPAAKDGYRVLIDRLWPRGLSKASAKVDLWLKDGVVTLLFGAKDARHCNAAVLLELLKK